MYMGISITAKLTLTIKKKDVRELKIFGNPQRIMFGSVTLAAVSLILALTL